MLSSLTKESLKVATAISLSIVISLSFGWDKAYWSVIAITVVAATESYSDSMEKAKNRLLGTLVGILIAVIVISNFSQSRFSFLLTIALLLFVSVFMSSHIRYGYLWKMSFTVCVVVASSGQFDNLSTFSTALLRVEHTVLSIIIFSIVYLVFWPENKHDTFLIKLERTMTCVFNNLKGGGTNHNEVNVNLSQLSVLLKSPLRRFPEMFNKRHDYSCIIETLSVINALSESGEKDNARLIHGLSLVKRYTCGLTTSVNEMQSWVNYVNSNKKIKTKKRNFDRPLKIRIKNATKAVCIFVTLLLLWIYIPIPGGYIMPMLAAILANSFSNMPDKAASLMGVSTAVWTVIILLQYVFIIPYFVSIWQLASLFFVNVFFVWQLSGTPKLSPQRIIVGNLLANFTATVLSTTPTYNIVRDFTLLTIIYMCLFIIVFYNKLFSGEIT